MAQAEKRCPGCGDAKSLAEFHRNRNRPDGHAIYCKPCANARTARWRQKHPDRWRESDRRYRSKPAVAVRKRAAAKQWREEHPERYRRSLRRWRARNPERMRELQMESKRRGRVGRDPDSCDYVEVLAGDPCCYCGGPADEIDHIEPTARGGTSAWDNLTRACRSCNARKHARPLLMFLLDA